MPGIMHLCDNGCQPVHGANRSMLPSRRHRLIVALMFDWRALEGLVAIRDRMLPPRAETSGCAPLRESIPMKRLAAVCVTVVLFGLGIGSAVAQPPPPPPPNPYGPVPPPRVEVVPPPRHGYYWEPGHWHWDGYRYVWRQGRWVYGGPRYGEYVPGEWRWNGHRYVWVPAHWR
jgi:hypothetical protein